MSLTLFRPFLTLQTESELSLPKLDDEIDIDLEDPDVEKAAIKIQASFRGHLSRHKLSQSEIKTSDGPVKSDEAGPSGQDAGPSGQGEEEEEMPDLNDPEVADAAAKIQAGFKKHMMKRKK